MIKNRDKHRGFTDRIYLANLLFIFGLSIVTVLIVIFSGLLNITDTSALCALIAGAYTELGIHTGFVIWKAKCENASKFNINIGDINDL